MYIYKYILTRNISCISCRRSEMSQSESE